jgi:hypothetical protein
MRKSGRAHSAAVVVSIWALCLPALAQDQQVQILRDAGLTDDLPYTVFYPNVLQSIDDGNSQTILTLQPASEKFFQCDVFAVQGGAESWTAEARISPVSSWSNRASRTFRAAPPCATRARATIRP